MRTILKIIAAPFILALILAVAVLSFLSLSLIHIFDEVQGTLETLFDRQYILTEDVVVEVRYRTESRTDSEGNSYTVEVPYKYYICYVTDVYKRQLMPRTMSTISSFSASRCFCSSSFSRACCSLILTLTLSISAWIFWLLLAAIEYLQSW